MVSLRGDVIDVLHAISKENVDFYNFLVQRLEMRYGHKIMDVVVTNRNKLLTS